MIKLEQMLQEICLKIHNNYYNKSKNTSSKLSAITFKYGDIVDMTPTFKSNAFEYKIKMITIKSVN